MTARTLVALLALPVAVNLGAAAGCGHARLILRDDPVLEGSQRRLARTAP